MSEDRLSRLIDLSLPVVEPEDRFDWAAIDPAQPTNPYVTSLTGLVELTPEQSARLAKEEFCSTIEVSIRLEAILTAAFGVMLFRHPTVMGPDVTYVLHEIGEETRHSRAFVRMLEQVKPETRNPGTGGPLAALIGTLIAGAITRPALWWVVTMAGEEIPDLYQRMTMNSPHIDPVVREVIRYHRTEEARHLGFARMQFPKAMAEASLYDRLFMRFVMPSLLILFHMIYFHPGCYKVVNLPPYRTWWRARKNSMRVETRAMAARKVLREIRRTGLYERRVPRGWQRLCGVNSKGERVQNSQ